MTDSKLKWEELRLPPINLWSAPKVYGPRGRSETADTDFSTTGVNTTMTETTAKPTLANEVKKFTGFIAVDGSTHKTVKEAMDHSRAVKTKAALTAIAEGVLASQPNDAMGVSSDESGSSVIYPEDLPTFLSAHREAILAAFNQEVRMRGPGRKKVVKPVEAATPAA